MAAAAIVVVVVVVAQVKLNISQQKKLPRDK